MHDFHPVTGAPQAFPHVFGNHHRAMLSSRTSKRDRQITLSFMDVMWKKVDEKIRDSLDELTALREGANVACHFRIASRKRPELWNKVRIRQEPHVKDKVSIFRNPMSKPEAHARDQEVFAGLLFFESLRDIGPKFVNIELRGIDDQICDRSDGTQVLPFSG